MQALVLLISLLSVIADEDCSSVTPCQGGTWQTNARCTSDGQLWMANWWAQSTPSTSDTAWKLIGTCAAGTIAGPCEIAQPWSSTTDYKTFGTYVLYNNVVYSNKWHSDAGVAPPSNSACWQVVATCTADEIGGSSGGSNTGGTIGSNTGGNTGSNTGGNTGSNSGGNTGSNTGNAQVYNTAVLPACA
eukprot:Blabericola_migrator_1__9726@NODE_5325_length_805_cov_683_186992_g3296_i1_p1_GENE_NODE_5325_length_805_cov_683_186992_g3296_i1NODE_5325_length_805_cov_683_186992_g3296_i1_p1_ORF_typecomplete_len188_score26_07CBM_5_12_2/PF14600_6/0_00016CBM_5_12_2/PF14600_6/0_011CBM_5_12_2/PF14600_6/3_5e03CBM_5_12/PF02839_14/0_29CBM_5_12/PF02839_14/57_NODE_5325_length_805_cov_683_186992_g3296_i139602